MRQYTLLELENVAQDRQMDESKHTSLAACPQIHAFYNMMNTRKYFDAHFECNKRNTILHLCSLLLFSFLCFLFSCLFYLDVRNVRFRSVFGLWFKVDTINLRREQVPMSMGNLIFVTIATGDRIQLHHQPNIAKGNE